MSNEKVIAYKGFNKDMTCLGFQYEEGKTYECEEAILCKSGFHACLKPLDVLDYYPPSSSVYHVVELDGVCSEQNGDSKVCASKITIGREISIRELSELAIEYAKTHYKGWNESRSGQFKFFDEYGIVAANIEGNHGVATAGDCGVASAGNCGVATAGNCGVSTVYRNGTAIAGVYGVATAGDNGIAIVDAEGLANAGYFGLALAGNGGVANSGDYGNSSSRGSSSSGNNGLSVARGIDARVKGGDNAVLAIAIEDIWGNIIHFNTTIVGQDGIKPETWYTLDKNGEFVEYSLDKN